MWNIFARIFIGCLIIISVLTGFFLFAIVNQRLVLLVYLVGVTVSIVISIILSAYVSTGIAGDAERSNNAHLKTKLVTGTKGILKWLMQNFNLTVDQVNIMVNDLFAQKDELNSIIATIQEGLAILDNKGSIILCNDAFKKIVQTEQVEERFYREIIREPGFSELVEKAVNEKGSFVEEVTLGSRIFLCGVGFISSSEKIVLTFYDLSFPQGRESMKNGSSDSSVKNLRINHELHK